MEFIIQMVSGFLTSKIQNFNVDFLFTVETWVIATTEISIPRHFSKRMICSIFQQIQPRQAKMIF